MGGTGFEPVQFPKGKTGCTCKAGGKSAEVPKEVAEIGAKWAKLPKAIRKAIMGLAGIGG
jgi:hypothetical protein